MNIRNQIDHVKPYNDQETKDKEMILNYLDRYEDLLVRDNETVHFTSSGFVLNEAHDKVLMVYHNIYNSWSWTGGHVDGNPNFLEVAIQEVKEETGVQRVRPIVSEIFTLDILPVIGHVKRGEYVSSHLHINVTYLLEVSEREVLSINESENSNVGWMPLDTFLEEVNEAHMKPVYLKIIHKAKALKLIK